jgi:hypothetical protein
MNDHTSRRALRDLVAEACPRKVKEDMQKLFVVLAVLLPGAADAEQSKPQPKPLVALRPVKQNPCAQYGPGFARVAETDTCIRIGGSGSVDIGGTR